ncbi:MAG TPA: aminotransferase class III-fold pyridoxal phosphate-dependent enzyme [Micromonosporaceae bacterium]|nr:aminotransferase class III-fold pyridoxal phosphate-dependent enzyme [Micromonosporaceae bacterium]
MRDTFPADEVSTLYLRHVSTGRAALSNLLGGVVEVSSDGAWVVAADGRRYLDFGGYGVFLLGHRHPRVVAEVHRQLDRHPLATRVFLDPVQARAAAAVAGVTPDGLDYVHFVNSGTEATETALKLARAHGRNALVTTRNGFHGKTLGALSLTSNPLYQDPFAPLLPETTAVSYGDLAELERAVAARAGRACVVVEPVQGEGGVVIPPPGYLPGVAALCRAYGALLVVDEIQTGMGRLGAWWGVDLDAVVPDILLVGKGLSGGVVPVAAAVTRADIYEPFSRDPFLHSSTFGGSPLACAAAQATVRTMLDEDIVPRAAKLGDQILAGVRDACAQRGAGVVTQVRGLGLLIGVECGSQATVAELVLELVDSGILVNHSLNASGVLRLTPPAILGDAEIDTFLTTFEEALTAVAARA